MKLNHFLLVSVFLLVSESKSIGRYLTCKLNFRGENNYTSDRSSIEFWPDYAPIERWVVEDDNCNYDVKIKFIPFDPERLIDYAGRAKGVVPTLDMGYFSGKNLEAALDAQRNETCSYDSVWYDPPARYYGYHGFKMSAFDSQHRYRWTGYAPVPFVRHVDAVFRDPRTDRTIFVANHWYYAFDWHGGYDRQGHLSYLWPDFRYKPYVDSVLITPDKTLCRFFDDSVQCSPFDHEDRRQRAGDKPQKFGDVYNGSDETPAFPLKGSFWIPKENRTAFLDSNDMFWIYDENRKFLFSEPFCEFMEFGKLSCCKDYVASEDSISASYFWSTVWRFLLF